MRSDPIPWLYRDAFDDSGNEVDDAKTVVVSMTFPERRRRISNATIAFALALVAFVCTFVGAGWSAVAHAPVARATTTTTTAPTTAAAPNEPVAVANEPVANVVSVPVVQLEAPWAPRPTKPRAGGSNAHASAPSTTGTPKAAPTAAAAPTPTAGTDKEAASLRDLNKSASSVLESSL
jgi:hypothetical protein